MVDRDNGGGGGGKCGGNRGRFAQKWVLLATENYGASTEGWVWGRGVLAAGCPRGSEGSTSVSSFAQEPKKSKQAPRHWMLPAGFPLVLSIRR